MKENGQEWKKERKKENGRGTEGWGVGDRQMFGPTYNREHERAQNVPQWSPGDGWDRRHHALEPSQPTLTITTIIHTHIQKDWTCKLIHFRILLTQWDSYCSIFTVSVADWNSSFFYQATVEFEYHCVMTVTVHCIWITLVLMCKATLLEWMYITLHLSDCKDAWGVTVLKIHDLIFISVMRHGSVCFW